MGLLTKIFGNLEAGASTSGEASPAEPAGVASGADEAGRSSYAKGQSSSSGIRPAVDTTPPRSREPRPNGPNRRPEHPRMYLRPTPAAVDPAVPGSTRRQQISVRASLKETARAPAPPVRRGGADPAATPHREPSVTPHREPSVTPRPPGTRPKTAMVVSPVSLTPEELQLPTGRQKMPTLLGLGAALRAPQLFEPTPTEGSERGGGGSPEPSPEPEAAREAASAPTSSARPSGLGSANGADPEVDDSIELEASDLEGDLPSESADPVERGWGEPAASEGDEAGSQESSHPGDAPGDDGAVRARRDSGIERRVPWSAAEGLVEGSDMEPPEDLTPMAQLLADFALKLSLGPVSRAWVPEVRRSALALLVTGRHRHETALAAVSSRLLELLPREDPPAEGDPWSAADTDLQRSEALDGPMRDDILHEVSRLAGLLPEWPAPALDLAEEARRRETRVVRELLASIDGLKRDHRARLEEQTRLVELTTMSAQALAEELVVPLERAQEIEQMLTEYRLDRQTRAPDLGNRLALRAAITELERKNDEFDDCDPEQKEAQRVSRGKRRQAMTAVQLLLAERGELDQLDQLEPLSLVERIERLRQWLDASSELADASEKAY